MRRFLRWLGYGLAGIAGLLLVGAVWVWFASSRVINEAHAARAELLAAPTTPQLAEGPRLARVLGCTNCHGEGLRGRRMFDIPGVATVWAPNLTELAPRATDQQLAQALRQGIGLDGRALWVMPSPQLSRLTDAETAVLVAYMRSLPSQGEATPETSLGPLGRLSVALGRFRPGTSEMEAYRVRQPYDLGPEHAAGRHLASIACAECHGPDLAGGRTANGIPAPGLALAGAYDPAQFRTLLRTGRAPHGRDLGLMREVSEKDFANLTDVEIASLYDYLRARAERVPN